MSSSLKKIFSDLLASSKVSSEDSYQIEKVKNGSDIFVGISPEGYPAILLMVEDNSIDNYDSISLNGIKTEFKIKCNYSFNKKGLKQATFNIVMCTDENTNMQDFFFNFFERFFQRKKTVSTSQLKKEIDFIRELFAHKKKPALKTIMGLWSELFIIYLSSNTQLWAEHWHTKPRSTFDFKFSRVGIDVKSFGGHEREHYFQIEQLNNVSVEQTLILSMCLKESDYNEGLSVFDLFNSIVKKIDDEKLIKKIEKLIFLIGGEENTDTKRFNENIAHDTLVILNGSEIPSLDPINTPPLVSEIKFKSNCSNLKGWEFNEKFQNLITSNSLLHSKIKKD